MSWEAWGTPEYLDWPECESCGGDGWEDEDAGIPCEDCGGYGFKADDYYDDRFEDDVI